MVSYRYKQIWYRLCEHRGKPIFPTPRLYSAESSLAVGRWVNKLKMFLTIIIIIRLLLLLLLTDVVPYRQGYRLCEHNGGQAQGFPLCTEPEDQGRSSANQASQVHHLLHWGCPVSEERSQNLHPK